MTEDDRSLQLLLDQGHGTPIWRAAMLTNQHVFHALLRAVEMYKAFIEDSHDKLRAEFELWKQRWHAAAEPPKTTLDAYTACLPVSKHIHPAAGARHFTRHYCHARTFLFHS